MSDSENLCTPVQPDAVHIKEMIALISTTGKDNLREHMDRLKVALKENPAACELLLPEDIGEMVKAIGILEGKMIFDAKVKAESRASRGKSKEKNVNLDPSALDQMIDEM